MRSDGGVTEPVQRRAWIPWAVLGPFAAVALARVVAHDAVFPLIWANSATPWIYAPAWIVLAWSLARGHRGASIAASLVVALHVAWMTPTLVPTERMTVDGQRLRVVTANVLFSHGRPSALERELLSYDADVLVLVEVSRRWAERIDAAPMRERYPHRRMEVHDGPRGIALLSRFPFARARTIALGDVPAIEADIELERHRLRLLGVHFVPPTDSTRAATWHRQFHTVARRLQAARGPRIALGDFNATPHASGIVLLERLGFRDAHLALGRGLAATWPNGTSYAPPLLLDHVLGSPEIGFTSVREGRGIGSNHRPVIADLAIDGIERE